ncbi:MAG: adenylate/guanylate cyclase domain-containing protein [Leptolyngbyaceae bacterium]|nr:adenylate/guanylate cyclase domain-containing protein [Leptolyngbyaceae bacterium]
MSTNSKLYNFLFDYTNTPDEHSRLKIEHDIWTTFGKKGAVFVLDMSGFSKTSQERGIIYYLAMVQRMQIIVAPIIRRFHGELVKFEADNCFAWFRAVEHAIDAAVGIQIAIEATNETTPEDIDIEFSCGIDYGEFLRIDKGEHLDFFGDPVNTASKLGEDLGESGEILISQEAMNALANSNRFSFEERRYSISDIALHAYCLDGSEKGADNTFVRAR